MSGKLCKSTSDLKLPNLHKEILEVKKRIQLSEGQRKALFEEIANEGKRDADEILRLKKEIAKIQLAIYEQRNNILGGLLLPTLPSHPQPSTVSSAPCTRVTQITGTQATTSTSAPLRRQSLPTRSTSKLTAEESLQKILSSLVGNPNKQRTLKDVVDYLDLQQIDRNKQLDLLTYRHKQKERKLQQLATDYQHLLIKKESPDEDGEERAKNKILAKEYRNRINAVQVQIKEAEHVRVRYKDIRWKLQEDAAKFESKMVDIEEDLRQLDAELLKVKEINKEALKLRSEARNALQKEERQVLAANATREKQSSEGKRLVEARQSDLAHLEKHLYNTKTKRGLNQDNLDSNPEDDQDLPMDQNKPLDPIQQLKQDIEVLNEATGSSCIEEVLAKVKGQTTTQLRLMTLRKTKENIKNRQQRLFNAMEAELEKLKFADDKSNQLNMGQVNETKTKINKAKTNKSDLEQEISNITQIQDKIVDKLLNSYLCMYQEENTDADYIPAIDLVKKINIGIQRLQMQQRSLKTSTVDVLLEELQEREGNWLPEPYQDIIRRTPLPNSSAPTPIPTQTAAGGSDDDDDLPTRNYLKRQAQLVVDAKNKRKTMRFPIPKTK